MTSPSGSLAALSDQLADAAARAAESLVSVHARPRLPSSGIHWRDGLVVTTEATVRRGDGFAVTLPDGWVGLAGFCYFLLAITGPWMGVRMGRARRALTAGANALVAECDGK